MSSPFKLDHVALGLRRMSDGLPLVRDLLGGVYVAEMPEGVFRWTQWRFANGGVLELLEPDGPPGGFLHRFLEARGPGFHHVTFKVPDLAAAAGRRSGKRRDRSRMIVRFDLHQGVNRLFAESIFARRWVGNDAYRSATLHHS